MVAGVCTGLIQPAVVVLKAASEGLGLSEVVVLTDT